MEQTRNLWEYLQGPPLQILIIVVLAVAIRWISVAVLNRIIKRMAAQGRRERLGETRRAERTQELSDVLMSQRRQQRAEAIGALLRSVITATVVIIALLLILPILGIDVAPLLASAGVLGVALGFGAQSLVKDYLSGIFLVFEDQYGVGDMVDLGEAIGVVEDVTLRITRLRDLSGVVWYVRNGEILRVANQSQGWVLAAIDIPVAYDENLDKVRECVEAVANDMYGDPQYDDMLLGKPSYAGVESVSGEAVFIKVIAKAAPEKQIPLTRAIRARVKESFDRAGVRVPVVLRPYPPGAAGGGAQPPA
ncbi:MAG TPA: mechanosensitive ion channel family protein [Candidatus Nanopelagicales bacterium]|nr:mechanosensitive ion channel family protein [Candidatus Nanopelagicales bacterium]